METKTDNNWKEATAPIPLESISPLPDVNEGQDWEKTRYWNSLLTGNPATVPDAVRQKAGAADERVPEEERDYRLMSNINRSWVVDFKGMKKEEVRSSWPDIRLNLARELGVRDSEPEVYTALSLQQNDAPERQKVRQTFEKNFMTGLRGTQPGALSENNPEEQEVIAEAQRQGAAQRTFYLPLAENVSEAWSMLKALETKLIYLPDVLSGTPDLLKAVDELAELPADERARVYAVARSLESTRKLEEKPSGLGDAMLHSVRRGVADLRHSLVQGSGHLATALTKAAGETLGNDTLRQVAEASDKRLQVLDEMRRVAQGEIFPIDLGEDSSMLEQLAVDAAGAAPGAALAFMGGAGFGVLSLAGAGAAVAEARQRAPQGRQELQTAAGIVGGALQAGIYMGMSRIGANMLNRTIGNFAKARHAGVKGYTLAALGALGSLTAENAKLLLAGKAAHASELGMQELAARVDKVASNIDWEAFGDNLTDIEANMREAAMNLPFVLIAAGRAALHHFRSPASVLENTRLLEEWGVDEAARTRIINEPDIHVQSDMLRDALRSSKRWSGPGALQEFIKSLKLLNTGGSLDFSEAKVARDFLNMEADVTSYLRPEIITRDVNNPAVLQEMVKQVVGPRSAPINKERFAPYLLLWDEWAQRGHGAVPQAPAEMKQHNRQYIDIVRDKNKGVPYYLYLNGYYHPFRGEAVRVLAADRTREIVNNSYRLLMNTESLDSLTRSYRSIEEARKKTETIRRLYISEFCLAMMRCVNGMPVEDSFMQFNEQMEKLYLMRRRGAKHAPRWMHQESEDAFREAKNVAYKKMLRFSKLDNPHMLELYRSLVSTRACGESLLKLLPHTDDFQTLLSMGFKPEEAYTHLLQREFKDHVEPALWNPLPLKRSDVNVADNMRRALSAKRSFDDYLALSGYSMESTPDGNGKNLQRIMCPDGRYSPWMKGAAHVMNTLVGNVQTSFLPMGKDMLLTNMQKSYRKDGRNQILFERRRMFPLSMNRFIGFDHLGNTAARDLCALWLGDSTQYGVGLEFSLNDDHWKRIKGKHVNSITKEMEPESGMFLVRHSRMVTPMDLVKSRFAAYWNRMLLSDWISPEEVGEALVAGKMLTKEEVENIIKAGRDRKADWSRLPGPVRRRYIKENRGRIIPGDRATMCRRLTKHMAELNIVYMLANLQEAPLPDSVKQWFLTTPFSSFEEPKSDFYLRHEFAMHSNRVAANEVKALIKRVETMRNAQKAGVQFPLAERMHNAYAATDARRYEQGWCFSMGGAGAFRAADQSFWNMLEDPARAWKLLPEERRLKITEDIQDVCGNRPVEEALQELSEMLRQYPELHAYGVETRGGEDVSRMMLNQIPQQNLAEPTFVKMQDARYATPMLVNKGFSLEKESALPENCRDDARTLPAIRLLTELRRQVTSIPYTDNEGIWWKKNRFGGVDGKRPGGLDESWTPEPGLKPMLDAYQRLSEIVQERGENGSLNVCGVPLGGINPAEIDTRKIKNITVYRCFEFPEHMVRLMPGEIDAPNPYQRVPYIMHTADGVPMLPTRQTQAKNEYLLAISPMLAFDGRKMRSYDYATNCKKRQSLVDSHLDDVVNVYTKSLEAWENVEPAQLNHLEICLQLFQDSRWPYFLATRDPETLTRGEALTCEMARRMLLAEIGNNRQERIAEFIDFCRNLRRNPEDLKLIKLVLDRVVSPFPNEYRKGELSTAEQVDE